MNRRDLLKISAMTGLGTGLLKPSDAEAIPRPPFTIYPLYEQDPLYLAEDQERHILVIGGGLAGMSAALELAERGYQVTLREAQDVLGGRLATRMIETKAGSFQVEHGLHMWFHNYHNFKDIRQRLGIDQYFVPHNETHFTFREYEDEILTSDPPVYPLNLIKLLQRSPNLNLFSAFNQLGILGDVLYYNHWDVYDRLDHIPFVEWAQSKVSKEFYDILLEPAASVTLNDINKISTAEMVMYMHFYFMGHPKAMWREVTSKDHSTAVLKPWEDKLRELGVRIEFNRMSQGLRFVRGQVVGTSDDEQDYDGVILACSVPGVRSILSQCVIDDDSTIAGEKFKQMTERLTQLEVAPPYKVMRVWFDRPTQAGRPDILETPQHKPINLVALFHLLEDECKTWAEENQGSILEFHLYAQPDWKELDDEQVWEIIKPVVYELYPELAEASVIDKVVGSYHDFSSFEVGQGMLRPLSDTPYMEYRVRGLALAGDWVSTEYPCALMERAVSTGREAANHFLLADRVRQAPLVVTNRRGPGIL